MRGLYLAIVVPIILLYACAMPHVDKPRDPASAAAYEDSTRKRLRALNIDDLLALENIGNAASAHNGRLIVYEKSPPYVGRSDFGVPRAWPSHVSSTIYSFDPLSGDHGRPLFMAERGTGYWLASREPFSPEDDYLALYSVNNCRVSVAAFDVKRSRLVRAAYTPELHIIPPRSAPVWVSADTLVYSALPSGKQPLEVGLRCHTGELFSEAWKVSWAGDRPSFREISNIGEQNVSLNAELDGRLIAFNAKTGVSRELAHGRYTDLRISANGRYLAALKQSLQSNSQPNEDWSVWSRSEFVIIDLASGQVLKPAPELDVFPGSFAWSPSESQLAFFGWPSGMSIREFGKVHVFNADNSRLQRWPHTGLELASRRERASLLEQPERFFWVGSAIAILARPLPDPKARGQFSYRGRTEVEPAAAPDWVLLQPNGKWRVLSDGLQDVSRLPLAVRGDALFVLANGDVWRLSASGIKRNLSASYPVPLGQPDELVDKYANESAAVDSPAVYFPYGIFLEERQIEDVRQYVFITLDKQATFTPLVATNTQPHRAQSLLVTSGQGATLFLVSRIYGGGTRLESLSNRMGLVERDTLNQHLTKTGPKKWRLLKYRSSISGEILESCMLLPFDYKTGQRYPAIINVYPSRVDSTCKDPRSKKYSIDGNPSLDVHHKPHLLAANGYIVLMAVSPPAEQRTEEGPLAGMPTLITDATNALIDQGFADPDRIGLAGVSQGGTAALWITGMTDQFKAVVSVNGWADYWSHYFQADVYNAFYHEDIPFGANIRYELNYGEFGLGESPWENPEAYIRNSPIFHVEDFTAPVLMFNSDMDTFSVTQYEEMYNALLAKKKPAKLITYWGEGHLLTSPANIRHMWESVIEWYGKYLQ